VYKTQDATIIPIVSTVLGMINSVCWFTFALSPSDMNIFLPNAIGFTMCMINVIFFIKLKKKKSSTQHKLLSEVDPYYTKL